ncbi:GNAT family N-acetyltransferase [Brevibacillus ginsengisoli]|uniref:GNAT family N-acetyltransferase n=1 Tax=Brevibacillus ginsengisoli TaxID=363854 RepID=UPI003CF00757
MRNETRYTMEQLNKEDIAGLVNLSASVGWDYDEQEIKTILSAGTVYGHKNEGGVVISSAAIIPYESELASIGMVIVHENYRGYRLGKELTTACIQSVPSDTTIMLIATADGQPLYEKLGFHPVSTVHKFICSHMSPFDTAHDLNQYQIVPLTNQYFSHVLELDRAAMGADRTTLLKSRIQQAKQGVVVLNHQGDVVGFGLGIEGPIHLVLGPIVAVHDELAILMIDHLMKGYRGSVRIDVPYGKEAIFPSLEKRGFKKVNHPPVMIRNSTTLPDRNDTLYGIAAQIFG